mgnify:CR=1 FL=1
MSKKSVIIDCFIVSLMSIAILFASFSITSYVGKRTAVTNLKYYSSLVVTTFKTEADIDNTVLKFKDNKDLRISIFERDGDIVLEINNEDKAAAIEDRKQELENNVNKFYYKESKTLSCSVLYFVQETDNYYIRVGTPRSDIENASLSVVTYGSIIVVIINSIYFIVKSFSYKKHIDSLKKQVKKLEDIACINTRIDNDDGVKIIENALNLSSTVIEQQINDLKEEKLKIDYILDSIGEGLVFFDKNQNVILINKYALNVLDLQKNDVIDRNYKFLLLGEQFTEAIKSLDNETSTSVDFKINGKVYEFLLSKVSTKWVNSDIKDGIGLLIIDTTDSRMNEKMKKEFFQNASHELKTPLTTIIGYQELLKNNLITNEEEIKNAEDSIVKEAKRMKSVIDDMMSLSSLELKNVASHKKEIDAKHDIQEISNSLSLLSKEKNVDVILNLEEVTLNMVPEDFDRLVRNLITNAIKYNKTNGKVFVTLTKNYLKVKDTGIGIEAKNINRIFERFYRVDKSRSRNDGGTGLGLAIVKHICLNYAFKIEVNSKIMEGSEFIVYFNPTY